MSDVLFDEAVTFKVSVDGLPGPTVMPVRSTVCSPAFSLIVTFDGVLIVGRLVDEVDGSR